MKKITKEECLEALSFIYGIDYGCVDEKTYEKSFDILYDLVDEYFYKEPLKWEEIEKDMFIFNGNKINKVRRKYILNEKEEDYIKYQLLGLCKEGAKIIEYYKGASFNWEEFKEGKLFKVDIKK